ncbi:Na+/H+ antiporter [Paenibacillus sp. P96]|uniref:Na+/H+ antiporter n=1 Tax=Paenibacillus zeirhizosphaerae TaxID=2987519 RepID=A0ABT9FVQ1_9BACL|nr:Na+/H+ antiporter [Paenibacillus sp. P96]MDP4098809.1 Na+/H+ antiporter [Paenibacillus sp. P96]
MDLLMIVLLLMVGLLISNIVSHYVPAIPTALIQVALGIIITLIPGNYSFEMNAEWFLLLFVAPILYNDGRHFPQKELWGMKTLILGNAFFLVILTTIGCGYVIHYLIPSIPLAAAFALGAILSPTDPVAVTGIAKRIKIPDQVMVLVKGESLINDASGLVAFKFAIAAVVTGYFSLKEAILDFSYVFLAGAFSGLVLGIIVTSIRFRLRKAGIHDATFHTLLQILTPFAIYIVTEHFLHASGVIAVVIAGIVHSTVKQYTETFIAEEQVLTENTWSMVLFILNGFVFFLLGMNVPSSMMDILSQPYIGGWLALGYVAAVGVTILVIRLVWSLLTSQYTYYVANNKEGEKPQLKKDLITTLTGVRGAVTMAGVLSIPLSLANGNTFPERSLIIFIAAGVILLLLVLATVFLPLLSNGEKDEEQADESELGAAKIKLLLVAIRKIKVEMNDNNKPAAVGLMQEYTLNFQRNLSGQHNNDKYVTKFNRKINEIRMLAINIQRQHVSDLLSNEKIDILVYDRVMQFFDMQEAALEYNLRSGAKFFIKRIKHAIVHIARRFRQREYSNQDTWREITQVQIQAMKAAITSLEDHAKTLQQPEYLYAVMLDYENILGRFKRINDNHDELFEKQKEELRLKVIDAERYAIRKMYETGEINKEQEKKLRRNSNFIESVLLYEHIE